MIESIHAAPDTLAGYTPKQILMIVWILISVFVAIAKHPEDRAGMWRAILSGLGRISMLAFDNGPRTLHFPFTKQPRPDRRAEQMQDKLSWALLGIPIDSDQEKPIDVAARLLNRLPRPPVNPIGMLLLAILFGTSAMGCLTSEQVLIGMKQLDAMSAAAYKVYGQCMAHHVPLHPVLDIPVSCRPAWICLDLTRQVSEFGLAAIAGAAGPDPWMLGASATAYKTGMPIATTLCAPLRLESL